jgi:hypothetical protein
VKFLPIREAGTAKLSTLVGIEYFRGTKTANNLFNGIDAKIRINKTLQLCQSMTLTRYIKPRFIVL